MLTQLHYEQGIFATEAPKYWAAGLHALPLAVKSKAPKGRFVQGWQDYSTLPIPETLKAEWLHEGKWGNIGVIAGEYANLCFIDVDTDDERVLKVLSDILPLSPWKRRGQKGFIFAYRCTPELARDPNGYPEKNFQLVAEDGQGIEGNLVEFKWNGSQVVVPPSIHPDTDKPYEATSHLYEVFDQLPMIFPDIRQTFLAAFTAAGIRVKSKESSKLNTAVVVAKGARDNNMTAHAGLMARTVVRGERTLQEAINEMSAWMETHLGHDPHDPVDTGKGLNQILTFLERDIKSKDSNRSLPQGWDDELGSEVRDQVNTLFTPEHREWSLGELTEWTYKAPRGDQAQRLSSYEYVVERAQKSPCIYNSETNLAAFAFMVFNTLDLKNVGLSTSIIKKTVSKAKFGAIEGKNHTEIARLLIEHVGLFGELRYENTCFWQWKGSNWEEVEEHHLLRIIAEEFGDAAAAKRQSDHTGILKLVRSLIPMGLRTENTPGVNFLNGYLDKNLVLHTHDPKYGATYTLKYNYEPTNICPPLFAGHLLQCWGEDEDYADKVRALRQAICTTLFGVASSMQRCFLLKGIAESGKSTVREVVQGLVPENVVSHVPPEQWSDKFMPVMMANKLLNVCGEISSERYISGKHFKEIIEGTTLAGQFKGKDIFNFRPSCAQWFTGNHLPKTKDTSEGFNRRFLILNFSRRIEKTQKIFHFHDYILERESGQIASWAVQEMVNLTGQGCDYHIPASSFTEVETMAGSNNTVRFFLKESNKIALDFRKPRSAPATKGTNQQSTLQVSEGPLFTEYTNFCAEQGARAVGLREFRQLMLELAPAFQIHFRSTANEHGQLDSRYDGITLARNFGASVQTSIGH